MKNASTEAGETTKSKEMDAKAKSLLVSLISVMFMANSVSTIYVQASRKPWKEMKRRSSLNNPILPGVSSTADSGGQVTVYVCR